MTSPMRILALLCVAAAAAAIGQRAIAQGWGWGGGGGYDRGSDRGYDRGYDRGPNQGSPAPVYGQQGSGQQGYGQQGYGSQPPAPRPQSYGNPNPRCRELEFQLANGSQNNTNQDQLPRLEADMRQADAQYYRARSDAERADCYEDMFLFGRSLRRSPRCIDLDRQVQAAKARLSQLSAQKDALLRSASASPRARRDEIIAELAHNRCGDVYVREYESQRSRSASIFSFFSDEDPDDRGRYNPTLSSSTYRTMCVRLCDGFYFPVSNTAVESQFADDEAKCRSQCAAPAELYYHRSDQDVDQMVALNGRPYSQMPNAFRNRKVFIRGCSCNQSEYSVEQIAKSEEALRQPPPSTSKRADASGKTASDAMLAAKPAPQANAPAAPPQAPAPITPAPAPAETASAATPR